MRIERNWIEDLIFGAAASRRFTQDSPVLPDVWIRYGTERHGPLSRAVDLLVTPHRDESVAHLATTLLDYLRDARTARPNGPEAAPFESIAFAFNQTTVVARLFFTEMLRATLPLSVWWRRYVLKPNRNRHVDFDSPEVRRRLAAGLAALADDEADRKGADGDAQVRPAAQRGFQPTPELLWLVRLAGALLVAGRRAEVNDEVAAEATFEDVVRDHEAIANAFCDAMAGALRYDYAGTRGEDVAPLFMVSVNRPASPTVTRSVLAIKGDAARRLFDLSCSKITWAVLDTGIDATHPAFRKRDERAVPRPAAFPEEKGQTLNHTRVTATYDFTLVRHLLSPEADDIPAVLEGLEQNLARQPESPEAPRWERELRQWRRLDRINPHKRESILELRKSLRSGRTVNWADYEDLLRIENADYESCRPTHDHGTHVAGILGGHWKQKDPDPEGRSTRATLEGVCPDINLYDLRVLDQDGRGDEFSIIAALQFVRYLNANRDTPLIHGVNLSLSIIHDVANYACGRTPVCDEAERAVASGVVVVAAAGNEGYTQGVASETRSQGYRSISITDPGNAESVITVGATHRYQPHTYGVSYFSSRGPTGDGRLKPDLVAPGEKIEAPVPTGLQTKDGTSMAAPHVSGAAALLMSRHRELIGQPLRVKQILCTTATDLGRERYFQGSGMLDVLRALQHV